ncbi:MAG: hypothetical protein KC910_00695 [Candidatus Eremiobacteraeota bacterium]|nr:hypothetical protein [Candidatus Eremiobacteraeota bacterium]
MNTIPFTRQPVGRASLSERLALSPPPNSSGRTPIDSAELPSSRRTLEIEPKRKGPGWGTLVGAATMLGLGAAGHFSGLTASPILGQLLDDPLVRDYGQLASIGQFSVDDKPVSADDAFRDNNYHSSYRGVTFTPEGAEPFALHSHDEVRLVADYLLRGQSPLSPEDQQVFDRIAANQPDWSTRGVAALLVLRDDRPLAVSYDLGAKRSVSVRGMDGLKEVDALYLKTPSELIAPQDRDALLTLEEHTQGRWSALESFHRLEQGEQLYYSYPSLYGGELAFRPDSFGQVRELATKVANQAEASGYRPEGERLQGLVDPLLDDMQAVYDTTRQQLEALEGVAGVSPQDLQAAQAQSHELSATMDELQAQFDDFGPDSEQQVRQLLAQLSQAKPAGDGQWWNPWTAERAKLVARKEQALTNLLESLDQPAAPAGWQAQQPLLEG